MVNIQIDNKVLKVPAGMTIMEAASSAGIPIPKLCFLKDINEIGACRICIVEIEGKEKLLTSCNNRVEDGMVIYTNSPKVRRHRKNTVEMILSQHSGNCVTCTRDRNCSLQKAASDLNILEDSYKKDLEVQPWDKEFPLIRDSRKCIKCMRCIQICDKVQNVNLWDVAGTGSRTTVNVSRNRKIEKSDCALCGQCIVNCPVGALSERDDTQKAWRAIENKEKITVVQVAPAVRAAWGEELSLSEEEATMGKIADALKRIGFDYVFDTGFSADLTIMEEGSEFLERFQKGETKSLPMFTSCCPGWLRYVKSHYPHLTSKLSTAKSPQQMFGAIIKTYFAKKIGAEPEDITVVSIMPCVAKKGESNMDFYYKEFAGKETDIVLTTREFIRMLKTAHINPKDLKDIPCDDIMGDATGAAVIFGTSGGVMEAALRTAYYLVTGVKPDPDSFLELRRGKEGMSWREAVYHIGGNEIKTAVVSGLGNTKKLIEEVESGRVHYDFVEVMACPGGCAGGGGQPIHEDGLYARKRGERLHVLDEESAVRFSHENKAVIKLYEEFLDKPLFHKSHQLLHTDHNAWEMPF